MYNKILTFLPFRKSYILKVATNLHLLECWFTVIVNTVYSHSYDPKENCYTVFCKKKKKKEKKGQKNTFILLNLYHLRKKTFRKINSKTPVLESLTNKTAGLCLQFY